MFSVLNQRLCAGLIAGTLMASAGGLAPLSAQEIPNDFTAIVREKIPAVVAITTKQIIQDQATLGDFFSPFGTPGLGPAQPRVR
ncbi:MAG: protease Do, partial [Mesorhizobium sp.]